MSYAKLSAKKNIENMAILEEIGACILSFEKMHPIALEKLKIVETHDKLHKTIKSQVQSIRRKLVCHQQRAIDCQNSLCFVKVSR